MEDMLDENSSDDYELFLLELNNNFTLSVHINGPLLGSVILIEAIIALIANLFVLIATQTDPKLRFQPSNIFLNSLLFGDLVMIVAVYPFMIISNYSGHWIFGSTVLEKYRFCQFVGFMFWFAVMLVFSTLAVISFDRWLFIIKPTIYKRFMKLPTALVIVSLLWVVCAILNSTPLYGLGEIVYSTSQGLCVPAWEKQLYYIIYTLMIFGTLITIIVVTSIWTCCFARSFLARSQTMTRNHQLYARKKRRVCGMFSALLLVCAMCFIPPMVVSVISAAVELPEQIYATLAVILGLFFTANPLIQSYFRSDVKNIIISMWNYIKKKLHIQIRATDDNDEHKVNSVV